MKWKEEGGNWVQFRKLPGPLVEVDFHVDAHNVDRSIPYEERMQSVRDRALEALELAQKSGTRHVLFIHGYSTSRVGKMTARSVVRELMNSKDATPYITRRDCIRHETVFVAAIKLKNISGIKSTGEPDHE